MPLERGARIGPYEVMSPLGAGGMGEVYRARDARLNRDVALKILPEALTSDLDRMARFRREAQVLASLNHTNIAAIFGIEDSASPPALVMELVEGETLSERLVRGPLPAEDALPIAQQIADALEFAHEKGVTHRDLKPANIKLTPDGKAKLLDFGLAKVLASGPTGSGDPSSSPTFTNAQTQPGMILGTAAYMSPEQAKGKLVDRRTDIWAFGCVLFEMLSGRRVFDGETVTDALAAVVRAEPEWSLLPAATPASIRELLQRCLQKDARKRLQAMGDARITLEEAITGKGSVPAMAPAAAQISHGKPGPLTALLGVLLLAAAVAAAFGWWRALHEHEAPTQRFEMALAAGEGFNFEGESPVAISPERRRIAYASATPLMEGMGERTLPPCSITPDGKLVALGAGGTPAKFMVLAVTGDHKLTEVQTAAGDAIIKPMFSPDGRWVTYTAVRGDFEVFVEPNPPSGGRWQASTQGGHWPLWSGDSKYLFYVDGNNDVVRTAVSYKNGFQAQATRVFFKAIYLTPGSASDYAASHDGQRILMMRPAEGPDAPTRMVIVLNWRQELDKVAPKSQ